MRKSPIAQNVSMDFLADLTKDFTGADITELCQRAAKAAIRESISAEEDRRRLAAQDGETPDAEMDDAVDPVPVINRDHFEEALAAARRSVTVSDLHKFEDFRRKFDPVYAKAHGGAESAPDITLNWPEDNTAQFAVNADDDDDDLYD